MSFENRSRRPLRIATAIAACTFAGYGSDAIAFQDDTAVARQAESSTKTDDEPQVCIFDLRFVEAASIHALLSKLYADEAIVTGEPKTNRLIVRARKGTLDTIEELLQNLDRENEARLETASQSVKRSADERAESVSEEQVDQLKKEYQASEEKCKVAAAKLRGTEKNYRADARSKQMLTEIVEQAFDSRQKLHQAELSVSEQKLEQIRQKIRTREGMKAKIIERRVDELLSGAGSSPGTDKMTTEASNPLAAPSDKYRNSSSMALLSDSGDRMRPGTNVALPSALLNAASLETILLSKSPDDFRNDFSKVATTILKNRQLKSQIEKDLSSVGTTHPGLGAKKAQLKYIEETLSQNASEAAFLRLEYDEVLKYLSLSLDGVKQQLETARKTEAIRQALFERGSVSASEVTEAQSTVQKLEVDLRRLEALDRLYRAAGASTVLSTEAEPSSSARPMKTFNFLLEAPKLGMIAWIEGTGSVTNSVNSTAIETVAGKVAKLRLQQDKNRPEADMILELDLTNYGKLGDGNARPVSTIVLSQSDFESVAKGLPVTKEIVETANQIQIRTASGEAAEEGLKDGVVVGKLSLYLMSEEER